MSPSNTAKSRPPVVTVMGHIDHGKTSLLDKIRTAGIASREAGGITQHIAAYQTTVSYEGKPKLITFIDTPGHAAFCQMRSRGVSVTDIVVLVISAQDGVMPQTKECLEHIKKADIPFIVAINKIDLPGASLDKVKGQLVELGFTPEDYGGQLACLPVSAKTGEGIDKLLNQIILQSEVMELRSEDLVPFEAIVIESKLNKAKGPTATAIVKKGSISPGNTIYYGDIAVKVKSLSDFTDQPLAVAGPGTPVEIAGFVKTPPVGAVLTDVSQPKLALLNPKTEISNSPKLNIIIRADVEGTLEALKNSFSDDVLIISSSTGPVSDNDVFMAENTKSQIFAFNVRVPKSVKNLAENAKVSIFESKIIYEIIENIQNQVLKLLEPTIDETILGEGVIKAEFLIDKVRIAGIQCTKGELAKGTQIHLKRDNQIIKDTKIDSLRQGKQVVDKVKAGQECGITFKPYVDFKLKDAIISYYKTKTE